MIKNILSFAILASSVALLFFYVRPLYDRVEKRRADIALLDMALGQATSIKGIIEETEEALGSISPLERARLETFLPLTLDEVRFANNIINIAREKKTVIEDMKISKKKDLSYGVKSANDVVPGERHATTMAQLSFIAPYSTMLLFLGEMERSLGLVNVNTLSLKEYTGGGSAKDSVPRYYVTVEFESYSLK